MLQVIWVTGRRESLKSRQARHLQHACFIHAAYCISNNKA